MPLADPIPGRQITALSWSVLWRSVADVLWIGLVRGAYVLEDTNLVSSERPQPSATESA